MFDNLKIFLKKMTLKKNNADNQKACQITQKVSDLGLHCLALTLKKDIRLTLVILFVWFDSLHPINNLSVIKGRAFLGWFVCLFDLVIYVPSTIFQLCRDRSSLVEPVLK